MRCIVPDKKTKEIKDSSIFGLHRQRRCQKVRLVSDCVACLGIYVPFDALGLNYVFVAKSALCAQRELGASLTSQRQYTLAMTHRYDVHGCASKAVAQQVSYCVVPY